MSKQERGLQGEEGLDDIPGIIEGGEPVPISPETFEEVRKKLKEKEKEGEKESQETSEVDFKEIADGIRNRLEEVWIGGDSEGEDIYIDADNSDEVMKEVDQTIKQASSEKWTEEKLMEKLGGITVKMDVDHARRIMQGASLAPKIKAEMLLSDIYPSNY